MIRHSTNYCPNCNAGFYVDAGILADDHRYRCCNCGSMIDIKMKWGKIVSVSAAPAVLEQHKGYGGTSTPHLTDDEKRVGNAEYWKEHHGDNWLQAHDEFMRKDDEWWAKHKND